MNPISVTSFARGVVYVVEKCAVAEELREKLSDAVHVRTCEWSVKVRAPELHVGGRWFSKR